MTRKITKSNQSEQRSDRGAKRSDRGGAHGGGAGLHPYGSHANQVSYQSLMSHLSFRIKKCMPWPEYNLPGRFKAQKGLVFFLFRQGIHIFWEHLMISIIVTWLTSYNILIVALVLMVESQGKRTFRSKTDISVQCIFRGACLFRYSYKAKITVKLDKYCKWFSKNVESSLNREGSTFSRKTTKCLGLISFTILIEK